MTTVFNQQSGYVSTCHGAPTYATGFIDGPVNHCCLCLQPCGLLTYEQYVADERAAAAPLAADQQRSVSGPIGSVDCINVARIGEPVELRYFGRGKGCSGQAHPTIEQAEADVRTWHQGKLVAYQPHATVPLAKIFPHGIPKTPSTWQQRLKNLTSRLARLIPGRKPGKRS